MKKANIADLKNRLSQYLALVKRGETILVMDRETPIARIVPVLPSSRRDSGDAWLRRLEIAGIVRVGKRKGVPRLAKEAPPGSRAVDGVKTLIDERRKR